MRSFTNLIKKGIQDPGRVPGYLLQRLTGTSRRWYKDGNFVTFEEGGFVSATSRDELLARHNFEARYIRRLLDKADTSLEVGCGFGRLSPVIGEFVTESHAIDINPSALQRGEQYYPEIGFTAANVTRLPFPDDYFDVVVSWTVLMHVPPKEFDRAVSEIKRVRSEEGRVVLCEGVQYPRNSKMPSSGWRDPENGHVWDRSVEEYTTAFSPLELTHSSFIDEYERFPGRKQKSGRIMRFEPVDG